MILVFNQHKPLAHLLVISLLLLATCILASVALAGAPHQPDLPPVDYTMITGTPLTILVANDASYQVLHNSIVSPSSPGLVYETSGALADSGLFVRRSSGGANYIIGPDFLNHETSAANLYDPWTPITQTLVTGNGTQATPFEVTTVVSHSSGVTMTLRTSYINGTSEFGLDWEVCQSGSAVLSAYLAADFYLQAGIPESSLGFFDQATGAVGAINQGSGWAQSLVPVTPANHYQAGLASDPTQVDLWDVIGQAGAPGPGFNDTVNATTGNDNGAGLQWELNAVPCASAGALWRVSPPGGGPTPADNFIYLPFLQAN